VLSGGETLVLPTDRKTSLDGKSERQIILGIRPQHLGRAGDGSLPDGFGRITATADLIQPTGTRTFVISTIGGVPVTAELGAHDVHEQGAPLDYAIDLNRSIFIDPQTEKVI